MNYGYVLAQKSSPEMIVVTPLFFLPVMPEAHILPIFLGLYRKPNYVFVLFTLKCSGIMEQ